MIIKMDWDMLSFISPAYAQASSPSGADFLSFLPLLAVLLILYVFFFRTQQKKEKQHKSLVEGLRKGDRVLTNSGLVGTIAKVEASGPEIILEIAEGVRVHFLKTMVLSVMGKGDLVKESKGDPKGSPKTAREKGVAPKTKNAEVKAQKPSSS